MMEAGDPFQIIRRFWAANNIAQNPEDPREWETLPSDVMDHVLVLLDKRNMANMRLVCKTWHACVNSSVRKLQLSTWPARSAFLANFTSLTSLAVNGPAIPCQQQRSDTLNPLLLNLALLPKLQHLALCHTGPGGLCNLELLTNLTSLEVTRAIADNSSSSSGMDLNQVHGVDLDHQQPAAALPGGVDWALPGAAEDYLHVPNAMQAAAAAAAAVQQHNTFPAGSSSSGASSSNDEAVLPASITSLVCLQSLVLESIAPEYEVLAQLKELRKIELRGRTPRVRGGLLVAANPLPGLGCLSGLTSLTAKCNYGISRLPADIGQLTALKHMDVSKNMLWGLPSEMTHLSSLQHLDVSSNCLASLPEDISALTALTHLDASNNSRVTLPAGLTRLSGLVHLNLSWIWSDLSVIWDGSRGLSSLAVLNVVGNGVAELPDSAGGFKSLRSLSLAMNNLSSLPDSISRLTSLTALELSDNRLAGLPQALCRLSGLASLGLRSNCLASLPQQVGDLASITYLDASMNHIPALPDSLTLLTNLNQLALSMNPLINLPTGLSALKNLKILEMYYVRLEGGTSATESGLGKLQQLIPGLYIFSNTILPNDIDATDAAAVANAAALEQQQRQRQQGVAAVAAAESDDAEFMDCEQDDEDLLLLLSPTGSSRSAAAAATPNSVFSQVTAASSSSAGSGSSYGMSATAVFGMNGVDQSSPGSSSSSSPAAAPARRVLFGSLSITDPAAMDGSDAQPDTVRSPGKDQQYRSDQQQLLPTSSGSSTSSRVTFADDLAAPGAAAASSSASAATMSWCQQLNAATAGTWPQLAAAAATAAANQPSYLQGAWSCDLSMIAAAAAAADASAAAASAAVNDLQDVVAPLRPIRKAHSVGRPLLSRYSRGGEATGSPVSSSGYGVAARFLGHADHAQPAAAGSSAAAAAVDGAESSAAAAAAVDAAASFELSLSERIARRRAVYDD